MGKELPKSLVLDERLDFGDKFPGQLQDLLGVVPLSHFWEGEAGGKEQRKPETRGLQRKA